MTRLLIADNDLSAKLRSAEEILEICDQDGHVLGYYHATRSVKSPYSREELERRRKEEGGRTLSEILNRLQKT